MTTTIYSLSDPFTNEVRYIGSTIDLDRRFAEHLRIDNPNVRVNQSKREWILNLRGKGAKPICEIIDTANDSATAYELERYWTWQFKVWGFDLLNIKYGTVKMSKSNALPSPSVREKKIRSTPYPHLVHFRVDIETMNQILKRARKERRTVSQTLRIAIDDTFLPKAKTTK